MLRMDFLSYSVENRSSAILDDIEFPIDVIVRNKNLVKNLEMKDLYDLDKDLLDLDRETVYDIGFVETVFAHEVRKSILDSPCLGVSSGEISDGSINKVPSTSEFNLDHSTKDLGFGTDLSGTIFEPNSGNEPMIDLKLGKCIDPKEVSSMLSSEESLISALVEDSLPAKRTRANCVYSQIPICQVQGCYKDLSSAKEYYKRHRVCDGHSKSAKVVINGIEQRFCQQCSRFHLLAEFDDGKRSCRKRLTGHNERRRKPQLSAHSGSTFFGMTLLKNESLLSPETLPGSFYYQERNTSSEHGKRIKLEEVPIGISQLAIPAKERSPSKSFSGTCNDAAVLSDSHCGALYLLSTKSHKSPRNSTGFRMTTPKNARENQDTRIGVDQKFTAQHGTSGVKNSSGTRHFPSGIQNKAGRPAVCSALRKDRFVQSSDYNCYMHCVSPEVGSTVDLLQLSSHLQRVEQLKISMQMKQENHSLR